MRCEDVQAHLSALLDGELSPPAREAVVRHVAACGRCALLLEELRGITRALDGLAVPETVDAADRVMDRLRAEGPAGAVLPGEPGGRAGETCPPLRRPYLPIWLRVAAAVVLAGAIGAYLSLRKEPESPVDRLVAATEGLFGEVGDVVAAAGRGITAVPENVAEEAKLAWRGIARKAPETRISAVVERGSAFLSQDLAAVAGVVEPVALMERLFASSSITPSARGNGSGGR